MDFGLHIGNKKIYKSVILSALLFCIIGIQSFQLSSQTYLENSKSILEPTIRRENTYETKNISLRKHSARLGDIKSRNTANDVSKPTHQSFVGSSDEPTREVVEKIATSTQGRHILYQLDHASGNSDFEQDDKQFKQYIRPQVRLNDFNNSKDFIQTNQTSSENFPLNLINTTWVPIKEQVINHESFEDNLLDVDHSQPPIQPSTPTSISLRYQLSNKYPINKEATTNIETQRLTSKVRKKRPVDINSSPPIINKYHRDSTTKQLFRRADKLKSQASHSSSTHIRRPEVDLMYQPEVIDITQLHDHNQQAASLNLSADNDDTMNSSSLLQTPVAGSFANDEKILPDSLSKDDISYFVPYLEAALKKHIATSANNGQSSSSDPQGQKVKSSSKTETETKQQQPISKTPIQAPLPTTSQGSLQQQQYTAASGIIQQQNNLDIQQKMQQLQPLSYNDYQQQSLNGFQPPIEKTLQQQQPLTISGQYGSSGQLGYPLAPMNFMHPQFYRGGRHPKDTSGRYRPHSRNKGAKGGKRGKNSSSRKNHMGTDLQPADTFIKYKYPYPPPFDEDDEDSGETEVNIRLFNNFSRVGALTPFARGGVSALLVMSFAFLVISNISLAATVIAYALSSLRNSRFNQQQQQQYSHSNNNRPNSNRTSRAMPISGLSSSHDDYNQTISSQLCHLLTNRVDICEKMNEFAEKWKEYEKKNTFLV